MNIQTYISFCAASREMASGESLKSYAHPMKSHAHPMNTACTPCEHYMYQVLRSFARDGIKKVTEADIAAKLDYGTPMTVALS